MRGCLLLSAPFDRLAGLGRSVMSLIERVAPSVERWCPELTAVRRDLHAHPELAFEEQRTAQTVEAFLERLRIRCRTGIAKTGIVAVLEGGKPGRTIAIRADM